MRLPLLDQRVPLYRGEALRVGLAQAVGSSPARRLPWAQALALGPLERLRQRLRRRHVAEQGRRPRQGQPPQALRVPYDELLALRAALAELLLAGHEELELAAALGRFHQQSLNLDAYVHFDGT